MKYIENPAKGSKLTVPKEDTKGNYGSMAYACTFNIFQAHIS